MSLVAKTLPFCCLLARLYSIFRIQYQYLLMLNKLVESEISCSVFRQNEHTHTSAFPIRFYMYFFILKSNFKLFYRQLCTLQDGQYNKKKSKVFTIHFFGLDTQRHTGDLAGFAVVVFFINPIDSLCNLVKFLMIGQFPQHRLGNGLVDIEESVPHFSFPLSACSLLLLKFNIFRISFLLKYFILLWVG